MNFDMDLFKEGAKQALNLWKKIATTLIIIKK